MLVIYSIKLPLKVQGKRGREGVCLIASSKHTIFPLAKNMTHDNPTMGKGAIFTGAVRKQRRKEGISACDSGQGVLNALLSKIRTNE